MLSSFNHLTLSVSQLDRSVHFYRDVLGLHLDALWGSGAYLSLPGLWLCLSQETRAETGPAADYTHYAFSINEEKLEEFRAKLLTAGAVEWKQNKSEGDSFYFLDPDGHKLEAHAGDLASRLASCRQKPYKNMVFFD